MAQNTPCSLSPTKASIEAGTGAWQQGEDTDGHMGSVSHLILKSSQGPGSVHLNPSTGQTEAEGFLGV